MIPRRLGNTDIAVGRISLGGLFTSSLGKGLAETVRILRRAAELGINLIDTAPAYADSEEVLGQALKHIDHPFAIATKLGGRPLPFDPRDAGALVGSVETSLRLLGRNEIELLLIHEPDRPQQYPWWTSYDPLDGPVFEAMDRLRAAGKIRHTGLAGTTTTELSALIRSDRFDAVLTAFNYNALYREASLEVIPEAVRRNMGIIAGSVYGQGFLGRRFDDEVRRRPLWLSRARQQQFLAFYDLLDQSGLSITEVCLRFALGNDDLSTILIGCKSMEQLEDSLRFAANGPLSHDIEARLNQIAALVPGRPFEEPMILPFGKDYFGPGMANLGAGIPVGKLV
jgi:aryl-alcohol dehydrogenase-like predicted oxidoreductase